MKQSEYSFITNKTCCFTGHRPGKLLSGEEKVRDALKEKINEAVSGDYRVFISGMAPGVDVWAAEEILALKETNKDIKLVCAVPYPGVEKNKTKEEKARFVRIAKAADEVVYVSDRYNRWCFQVRDKWMVDHSSLVIAVFNGTAGGTKITLDYAKEQNIKIKMIDDKKGK